MAGAMLGSLGHAHLGASATEIQIAGKAAYLADCDSGTAVYSRNETERLPIASMCKIMTLLLSFEAIEEGALSYDDRITVSERASGMGGSQVFLECGSEYSAEELMKSVAVCSANDSCVALAEQIAGSEEAFVDRMNSRARELGAENTLFSNCTGLPKDPQYSCAKDVAAMLRELLRHEKYFSFSKIRYEEFRHPDGRVTSMTNTNKLMRSFPGCDGGKTGFTSEAGFCLAATAKRGETRLISVVIGAADSDSRFKGVASMLEFAFERYTTRIVLDAGTEIEQRIAVRGGKQKDVGVVAEHPLKVFTKRGQEENFTLDIVTEQDRKAPVGKGDVLGTATLFSDGVEIASTPLVANTDIARLSWWDAYRKTARNWQ